MEATAAAPTPRLSARELNVIIKKLIQLAEKGRDVRKAPEWEALHAKDKKKVVRALSTGVLLPETQASLTGAASGARDSSQDLQTQATLTPASSTALASSSTQDAKPPGAGLSLPSAPVNLMANIVRSSNEQFKAMYQPPVASETQSNMNSNSALGGNKRGRAGAAATPTRKKARRKRNAGVVATRYYLEDEVVTDSDVSDTNSVASDDEAPSAAPLKAASSSASEEPALVSAAEAKKEQLAARRAKRAAAKRESGKHAVKRFVPRVLPEGAQFCSELRAMMYGFGDNCHPSLQVAAALEADAMRYAGETVRMLRVLSHGKPITLRHIMQHMGGAVAVYFRWKAMKKMAKGSKSNGAAAGSDDETGADDDMSPVDDVELHEWEEEGGAGGGSKHAGDAPDDASLVWDDSTPAAPVHDGLAKGMLLAGDEDDDEADLAAELEANAELEMRAEGSGDAPKALTEEELRSLQTDGPPPMVLAPPNATGGSQGSHWQTFKTRLRFANVRTRSMSTLQYREFARCREAYFTATPSLVKAFSGRLPRPALKRQCLDVIAYCAFDRVACVVEAANRIVHNGVLSSPTQPLPEPAYTAALAALPARPPSLELAVRTLHAAAKAQQQRTAAATAIASGQGISSVLSPEVDRAAARKRRLSGLAAAAKLAAAAAASQEEGAAGGEGE